MGDPNGKAQAKVWSTTVRQHRLDVETGSHTWIGFDNSTAQHGRSAEDNLGDAYIGTRFVGSDMPRDKSHMEAVIGTFLDLIFNHQEDANYDIARMRRYGFDPANHVICSIETGRRLLARAVMTYNVTRNRSLDKRQPALMWKKELGHRKLPVLEDVDRFAREIGRVYDKDITLTPAGIEKFNRRYTAGAQKMKEVIQDFESARHIPVGDITPKQKRRSRDDRKTLSFSVKIRVNDDDIGSMQVTAYVSCGYGSNEISSAASAQDGAVRDASAFELLGMRPAAVESRIKDETLEEFWKAGVFTKHRRAHGDRMLPAVERAELMAFAARWHDRIKSETFAYQLGISHHGVEQLIALGMVSATAPALPGQPLSLTSSQAAGFVEQVRSNAMSSIPCSIPLREAALVIGGRLKPWGPIFAALLDQTIPYTVSEDGASLLDRIAIQEADAGLLSTLRFDRDDHPDFQFADRMMQNDALATLNTTKRSAAILAGLKTQGVNPKTYALTDVEKRAAKVMTLAEIGAVLQLDIVSTRHRLKNVGLQPLLAGAYDRSCVEPYLEVIAKLGAPGRNRTRAKRQFERFLMKNTAEKAENDAAQSRAYVKNSL